MVAHVLLGAPFLWHGCLGEACLGSSGEDRVGLMGGPPEDALQALGLLGKDPQPGLPMQLTAVGIRWN